MLRLIEDSVLASLKELLADDQLDTNAITVQAGSFVVRNHTRPDSLPLRFRYWHGSHTEPLLFGFTTWNTQASLEHPDTFLTLGTEQQSRVVGFPLYLLPQDDQYLYLSFKLGNGEGGKNRWFGRARGPEEPRSQARTEQLGVDLRQALQQAFPEPLLTHPTLGGDWLVLARLALADLAPTARPARRKKLKTLVLSQLLQAFVIAEQLRADSFLPSTPSSSIPATAGASVMSIPRNQLLFGPPGTGKTYHTSVRALSLLTGRPEAELVALPREQVRQELAAYRTTGQLEFVTFHQAFSYEDFVEGIKPVMDDEEDESVTAVQYAIKPGIFKLLTQRAAYALSLQQRYRLAAATPAAAVPDFDTIFQAYEKQLREQLDSGSGEVVLTNRHNTEYVVQGINTHGTVYLKYKRSVSDNLPQVTRKGLLKISDENPYVEPVAGTIPTYHISHGRDRAAYWAAFHRFRQVEAELRAAGASQPLPALDVAEALRRAIAEPELAAEASHRLDYTSLIATDLQQAPRFVLIIDEINRGNVANIFGELITLLEKDKRAGQPEMLTVQLPYSKHRFTVPDNLYLLGTMNTADRSVEALDTALRRRFSFTPMLPDPNVIRAMVGTNGVIGAGPESIDVAELLIVLNSRLEQLLDTDHCLGHALLLDAKSLPELRIAFAQNILPLLQEYFFADWGKIGLVLGTRFVQVLSAGASSRRKLAALPGYSAYGQGERSLYRLTDPTTWDAAAFQSIYADA